MKQARVMTIPTIMQVRNVAPAAAAIPPWYLVAGKTCVAAYQPKGAASLALSYVNLANPGTYDAAPGTAPTFNAATGWTFDGATQYLTAAIPYAGNQTWSAIVRYTSATPNTNNPLIGNPDAATNVVVSNKWGTSNYLLGQANKFVTPSGTPTSGVLAIAGTTGYSDGISVGTIAAGSVTNSAAINFGRFPNAVAWGKCAIQAVAVYSAILAAGEVATVSAAMAAL